MTNFDDYPAVIRKAVDAAIRDHFEEAAAVERLTAFVEKWQPETERSERAIQTAL